MKESKKANSKARRMAKIVKVSVIGIIANIFLASFKAFVGIVSGSIAIVLDAVNNLSDAASSIITIVGAKLAGKRPDRNHPFGHGRIEYLSAMAIGIIVLYTGATLLIESIKKIITPNELDYSLSTFVVVIAAIVVKIVLGCYVSAKGKKLKSQSLSNSGKDALLDSIISFMTLVAAIIYVAFGVSLEAYLAVIISLVIIKSGIEMLREATSSVLGERPDANLIRRIHRHIRTIDNVYGSYDLVINNYGPDMHIGSVNVEVNDVMQASEIDELSRKISATVYDKDNVILSSIGIYARNTKDLQLMEKYDKLESLLKTIENVLQIHGFYINKKEKTLRFDVVMSFDEKHPDELLERVLEVTKSIFPEYEAEIVLDSDFALA